MTKIQIFLNGESRDIRLEQIQCAIANGKYMEVLFGYKWYTTTLSKADFDSMVEAQ